MCTYGISVQEIYDSVNDCLDGMEGDFDRATLNQALDEVKKDYKYVSDEDGAKSVANKSPNKRKPRSQAHRSK